MIGKLFRLLLDSILPRRCRKCGQILTIEGELCEKCLNELNFIFPPYCRKCGHPLSEKEARGKMLCASCLRKKRFPFRLSRSALCYDEASKNLILAFKFMDRTENARLLAAMLKVAGEDIFKAGVDVIVPVPLHYTRLVKRRYNQAALLARELGRYTGLPVDCFSLVRHRKTRPQVEFSGFERGQKREKRLFRSASRKACRQKSGADRRRSDHRFHLKGMRRRAEKGRRPFGRRADGRPGLLKRAVRGENTYDKKRQKSTFFCPANPTFCL